jgi:hypothetical protein
VLTAGRVSGVIQLVPEPLMVSLSMVVRHELVKGAEQATFPEEDQAVTLKHLPTPCRAQQFRPSGCMLIHMMQAPEHRPTNNPTRRVGLGRRS